MAWETRNGSGSYYTRSIWVDGRVVRQYVGCGEKGKKAARRDAEERTERARRRSLAREMEAEEKARQEALERPIRGLDDVCRLLMWTALEMAGYHRPKRWKWRRRRVKEPGR